MPNDIPLNLEIRLDAAQQELAQMDRARSSISEVVLGFSTLPSRGPDSQRSRP